MHNSWFDKIHIPWLLFAIALSKATHYWILLFPGPDLGETWAWNKNGVSLSPIPRMSSATTICSPAKSINLTTKVVSGWVQPKTTTETICNQSQLTYLEEKHKDNTGDLYCLNSRKKMFTKEMSAHPYRYLVWLLELFTLWTIIWRSRTGNLDSLKKVQTKSTRVLPQQ